MLGRESDTYKKIIHIDSRDEIYEVKAKGIGDNKWHIGVLIKKEDRYCHIRSNDNVVWVCLTSSICRCTGLMDKAQRKIWEHDIVKCIKRGAAFYSCLVVWNFKKGRYDIMTYDSVNYPMIIDTIYGDMGIEEDDYEVIGNIFDNPDIF